MKKVKKLYKEYEQLKKQYRNFLKLRDINKKQLGLYPRLHFISDYDKPRVLRLIDDAHGLRAILRAISADIKRIKQEISTEHRKYSQTLRDAKELKELMSKCIDKEKIYVCLA
jgi:hypothetical protein